MPSSPPDELRSFLDDVRKARNDTRADLHDFLEQIRQHRKASVDDLRAFLTDVREKSRDVYDKKKRTINEAYPNMPQHPNGQMLDNMDRWRYERLHNVMLAWLLDPKAMHHLSAKVYDALRTCAAEGAHSLPEELTITSVQSMVRYPRAGTNNTKRRDELDIVIEGHYERNDAVKPVVVVVELKTSATPTTIGDQCKRYIKTVTQEHPQCERRFFVLITPWEDNKFKVPRGWIHLPWSMLARSLLPAVSRRRPDEADSGAWMLAHEYVTSIVRWFCNEELPRDRVERRYRALHMLAETTHAE